MLPEDAPEGATVVRRLISRNALRLTPLLVCGFVASAVVGVLLARGQVLYALIAMSVVLLWAYVVVQAVDVLALRAYADALDWLWKRIEEAEKEAHGAED